MKKIVAISLDNLYATPYLNEYIKINDEIDIIYWNRNAVEEELSMKGNIFEYKSVSKNKLINYYCFYQFIKRVLKQNKHDKIILLHGPLNIMLNKVLKSYKNKYILDIRDYTFEKNRLYYFIQKRNIRDSYITVISSHGYLNFLPSHNYVMHHNIQDVCIKTNEMIKKKESTVISQIGTIRFLEENVRIINYFQNDERFILKYIGNNSESLKQFIRNERVHLEGYFPAKETLSKYEDASFINNMYGNSSFSVRYALSNKLYLAAQLRIPILVSPNTYMEEIVDKYKLGLSIDLNDLSNKDKIIKYQNELSAKEFEKKCDIFLNEVFKENEEFYFKIKEFCEK